MAKEKANQVGSDNDAFPEIGAWADATAPERVALLNTNDAIVGRFCGTYNVQTAEGQRTIARFRDAKHQVNGQVTHHKVVDVWVSARLLRQSLDTATIGVQTAIVRTPEKRIIGSGMKKGTAVVYQVRQNMSNRPDLSGCLMRDGTINPMPDESQAS